MKLTSRADRLLFAAFLVLFASIFLAPLVGRLLGGAL